MKVLLRYLLIALPTVTPLEEVSDVILSYVLGGCLCSSVYLSNPPLLCISLVRIQSSLFLGAFCITSAKEMQALQGH